MTQSKTTTVGALLDEGIRGLSDLTAANKDVPVGLEARVLLGHALQLSRARIISHPVTVTDAAHAEAYRRLLARRATAGGGGTRRAHTDGPPRYETRPSRG